MSHAQEATETHFKDAVSNCKYYMRLVMVGLNTKGADNIIGVIQTCRTK